MSEDTENSIQTNFSTEITPLFRQTLNAVAEGMFAVEASGQVFCNHALCDILKIASCNIGLEELLLSLRTVIDSNSFNSLQGKLINRQPESAPGIITEKSTDNKTFTLDLLNQPPSGIIIGVLKENHPPVVNQIQQSSYVLNSVFDAIEDGILILTPDSLLIKRANQAASRIFELSNEQLLDKCVLDLITQQSRLNEIKALISNKLPILKSIHIDLEMNRSNGAFFPALHGIFEITSSGNEVIALMWITTDMSQRVFINRTLVNLETRYRLLFDRTADPIFIIDAGTRAIIDANLAAVAQLGYKRNELVSLNMDDITPASRRGGMERDFGGLAIGESKTIEGVNLTKSGTEIPVQISAIATDYEGRKVFIASCRDISQQILLEKERLRIENLDTVRKLAGGLAHEFSQPLQGLTTIVDLLASPNLPPNVHDELLKKIEPSVVRLVGLLEQMKKIVRIETKPYTGSVAIIDIEHST